MIAIYAPCLQPLLCKFRVLEQPAPQHQAFLGALLGYLLQEIDFNTLAKQINWLSRAECSTLRTVLVENVDWAVNVKLALCQCIKSACKPRQGERHFLRAHLTANDASLYAFCQSIGLADKVRPRLQWRIPTPEGALRRCKRLLNNNKSYIEKYAWKKLKFIATSNKMGGSLNQLMVDLCNDLRCKMIQTYYQATPFRSRMHTINLVRYAVVNEGNNLISYFNAAKRKRLRQDADGGWENIIQTDTVSVNGTEFNLQGLLGSEDPFNMHELRYSVQQVYRRASGNLRQLLDLLAQKDDAAFVQWYNAQHRSRCLDIEAVYTHCHRTGRNFAIEAGRYLQFPRRTLKHTIQQLRESLGAEGAAPKLPLAVN